MSDRPPPDFATLRAVEILASLVEKREQLAAAPPVRSDRPIVLFNETYAFALGTSTRAQIERALGTGFAFPAPGWHTYGVKGPAGERLFLSAIYQADRLVGVEHYLPKMKSSPALAPRNLGAFRLVPGEIGIGGACSAIGPPFSPSAGGPSALVYATAYEAHFPGGIAYAMGNDDRIERLVLYAGA